MLLPPNAYRADRRAVVEHYRTIAQVPPNTPSRSDWPEHAGLPCGRFPHRGHADTVVTGGIGTIPGATMFDKRRHFIDHLDHIRQLLMNEPRGHAGMSGAILQPSTRPDADSGVVYIEVSGCLPMCGHGTMGVVTVFPFRAGFEL
jgi:hypothetical protein